MKTAVFLQVRLDSSRLPRKALLKLGDRTVFEHAMRALDGLKADTHMVLTTADSVQELGPLAEAAGWKVFAGPKDDVLARFVLAARFTGAGRIVRATGDNPLVSGRMAAAAVELSRSTGADYAGYAGIPVGSGVEVIRTASLEQAFDEAEDPYEREHVAPFLYRRPERFHIEIPMAPVDCVAPDARITLDTPGDFEFLNKLYDELYTGEVLDLDTVIPYLLSGSPGSDDSNRAPHAR